MSILQELCLVCEAAGVKQAISSEQTCAPPLLCMRNTAPTLFGCQFVGRPASVARRLAGVRSRLGTCGFEPRSVAQIGINATNSSCALVARQVQREMSCSARSRNDARCVRGERFSRRRGQHEAVDGRDNAPMARNKSLWPPRSEPLTVIDVPLSMNCTSSAVRHAVFRPKRLSKGNSVRGPSGNPAKFVARGRACRRTKLRIAQCGASVPEAERSAAT